VFPRPPDLGHAYARHGQAELARRNGEFAEARAHLAVAAELARKTDTWLEGRLYLSEAALHADEGQADQQLHALEQAVDCFSGASAYQVQALDELARARAAHEKYQDARAARDQADLLYEEMALPEEDRRYRNRPSLPEDAG
jgi:tetratricopeptide (TPR) repeat protein